MKKSEDKAESKGSVKEEAVHIAPPNIKTGEVWIRGTAPLVIHAWSKKVQEGIKAKQEAGSTANSKKHKEAKNFEEKFNEARPKLHFSK